MTWIHGGHFMHKNETLKTIKERRSIRNYKENQIKDEQLETIVEAQNMLLAAESIGLGGCFIYYVVQALELEKNNVLLQEIKIPDEYKPCTTIIIGYKKSENISIPERKIEKINYIK
jgi:nitroreductase